MPRMGGSAVAIRWEFVLAAQAKEISMRALCRRFRISAPTAYKWLRRFQQEGSKGLADRSHRPHRQPRQSSAELEQRVLAVRAQHPAWGGRKIRVVLARTRQRPLPSASTISAILRRHGQLAPEHSSSPHAFLRFEHAAPNELWQMDFKGHFALRQGRCHPLTVLDDHSRFALALKACADERDPTVRERLTTVFRTYGLPRQILADNGAPFGTCGEDAFSSLEVWLLRLGIAVLHGRPRHPQTQGKEERFHRTLRVELLHQREFSDLSQVQREFDDWRQIYNFERPHQALAMEVPATRYRPSPRPFPEALPALEYAADLAVRKVQDGGRISFHNRHFRVGKAFLGLPVGLRPTTTDGLYQVFFHTTEICRIDLRAPSHNV